MNESALTLRGDRAHRHVPDEFCVDLITNHGDAIVDVFEIASGAYKVRPKSVDVNHKSVNQNQEPESKKDAMVEIGCTFGFVLGWFWI